MARQFVNGKFLKEWKNDHNATGYRIPAIQPTDRIPVLDDYDRYAHWLNVGIEQHFHFATFIHDVDKVIYVVKKLVRSNKQYYLVVYDNLVGKECYYPRPVYLSFNTMAIGGIV